MAVVEDILSQESKGRHLSAANAGPLVRLSGVSKAFGSTVALHEIDLAVRRGEFLCVVGASGCGKTTLLNLIAGLDRPTSGSIESGAARTGLLFQDAALFPWLTAQANVELAL